MNHHVLADVAGLELSETELAQVIGGSPWSWIKKAAKKVGHFLDTGAGKALTSLGTVVLGALLGSSGSSRPDPNTQYIGPVNGSLGVGPLTTPE